MKPFQIATLFVFGALALIAVFVFASFSGNSGPRIGVVTIWGSLPEETVDAILTQIKRDSDGFEGVRYREISEGAFAAALIEAIAAGRSPDLIVLPSEEVVSESDKIIPLSFRSVSRREFQDSFLEAGEIFLSEDGVLGLPFYINPFVLFWNRTLFSTAGIARPPRYWDEIADAAPKLSRATDTGTIAQSAIPLGEWDNIPHAKSILLSLFFGLGNRVMVVNDAGELQATLSTTGAGGVAPAESALRFFTDFADPVKAVYSWNRSLPNAQSAFTAGTVAMYLAPASEVFSIRSANPNLNFDVAPYPLARNGIAANPSRLYALSIPRGAPNPSGAAQVALLLSGNSAQATLSSLTGLPSVRRDILSESPENPYEVVFRDAALSAFSFYDPDPHATDAIFKRMIEDVSSGRLRISEAVRSGQAELAALIKK